MPDIYPDFPYRWVSWSDWLSKVDTMVQARLNATTVSNVAGWEIWNEPDWTWDTANAGSFNEGWVRTYQRIRSRDTLTPIVGPGTAGWNPAFMQSFLSYAKANNALPDVVIWHELNHSSASVAANVAAYRQMESSLGISPRPISINEYAWTDEVDVPGRVANYLAKLERAGVANAQRAFWFEYGTVNGLVVNNTQPTGTWWLYKWYGDMAGRMVTTTPPAQSGLDGLAAYDSTRKIVNVVFSDQSGTNSVRVTGLGALGSAVRVTVESTPANGRSTGRIANCCDARTDSYVDFVVNVPTGRAHTLAVRYANIGGSTATQGLAYDGGAWSSLSYPATGAGQFGTVTTTVNLTAGYNVIRLAKGAPHFSGGTGSVDLDYIELT